METVKCKRKRISKKSRRSWRKHVDIKDVDEFLENVRLEERLGPPLSAKLDSELFSVDVHNEVKKSICKSSRRAALRNEEAKCFSLLKPHTSVPDPISKRNTVGTRKQRDKLNSRSIKVKEAKDDTQLKKNTAANETVNKLKKRSLKRDEFTSDIWQSNDTMPNIDTEWMTSDAVRHTLSHFGRKKRKVPKSLFKKTSMLLPIEAPHSGTSYNPSYQDHQDLLQNIVQKELQMIKQEAHLNRVTTQMFKKVSRTERDENIIKELSENLSCVDEDDLKNDIPANDTNAPVGAPHKVVKKTLKQRRKQKEQKELATKRLRQKIEKKKISDMYKLKVLQKQFDEKEKRQLISKERKLRKQKIKSKEPKTLSKLKFEAAEPDFKLAEELAGNLRNSEPAGNLLKDRYKSLQQRNIIPPTALVKSRSKARVKRFLKDDHKIRYENK